MFEVINNKVYAVLHSVCYYHFFVDIVYNYMHKFFPQPYIVLKFKL
jgi:hypothetical protein